MEQVKILQVAGNIIVDAQIVPMSSKHIADYNTFWKARLITSIEEDSHWEWENKFKNTFSANYERFALECKQITQGLMIIELDYHRSRIEQDKSLIYLDYLASAPWNRPKLVDPIEYKRVGLTLLVKAVTSSFELDYKGRIGLHSLPNAKPFYKKIGMIDLGCDPDYSDLTYFELSASKALQIIRQFGLEMEKNNEN